MKICPCPASTKRPASSKSQWVVCIRILFFLNLHPILESEHQIPIVMDRDFLHHCQPERVFRLRNANLPLMEGEHNPADDICCGLPLFLLLLEDVHPVLGFLISRHITVVAFGRTPPDSVHSGHSPGRTAGSTPSPLRSPAKGHPVRHQKWSSW